MTAHVLITGALFRAPEQRTSKAGKPFVTATLKVKDGDAVAWWKLLVFSESAQAELLRLGDGDALSAQGVMRAETFENDGVTRISFTIIADAVLALLQPPKERKPKPAPSSASAPDRSRLARHAGDGEDVFGDDMPF